MVRWHEAGKLRRKFFAGKEAAEAHAISLRGSTLGADQQFLVLPQVDKEKLMLLFKRCQERNIDLLGLLTSETTATAGTPTLEDALTEMLLVKKKSGRADEYVGNLRIVLSQFTKGRERMLVNQITLHDVESFLNSHSIEYRSTLRSRLSTLFNYCVRRNYLTANPCSRLEAITVAHKPPSVLTFEETQKCLDWLQVHSRSLAWFALSTFVGLRPEEAEQTTWKDINFKEGWVKVEAQTTKVRQRRVVYPLPMAMKWLQRAQKLKSDLPLDPQARRRHGKLLREVLGWKHWKKDVTRHTAASMWLATCGSTATVATALGNSESILRKNYMALVTKTEAQAFWQLLPRKWAKDNKTKPGSP
jgi:integrase